ncbi:MAG: TolC family protein [Bacteroidales bacterium]|nr:TolC family protein [Bacteroidales bacterium]MCF8455143.1 TolC family protein [Bacteroidales bacterium]
MKRTTWTRTLLLAWSFLIIPLVSMSQEAWTLEQCIDYALEHNIQVKQQALNTEYSKNTLQQSKFGILPSLNGSVSGNLSSGRSVDPFTYEFTTQNVTSYNFAISSSATLFSGLQQYNNIKANEFNLKASIKDFEKLKNDIALNISAAYLQILFAEELVAIAEDQLGITQQQVDRTEKLVEAGSLAQGSLLEIQAQEASEELQLITAQNNLDLSYLTLTQLLELGSTEDFKIVRPQIDEINEGRIVQTVGSIYAEGVELLPQIQSAEYKLRSSEKNLAAARGAYLPRLSISASYYTGYSNNRKLFDETDMEVPEQLIGRTENNIPVYSYPYTTTAYLDKDYPFADQFKDNAYKSVSLSLTIPIFNNLQVMTGVKNSKLNVLSNQYTLESTKNQLYKEIQQAHADAVAALKKYKASEKSLAASQESFRYTQQKFDVGLVTTVDFNLAKTQLARVQSDLLQAKYEYLFKSNVLQFYRGKPIQL